MNEQEIFQASKLERKHQELEQNLQLIENQIQELEQFKEDIEFLIKSEKKESLSSIGKGVFIRSRIEDKKDLFVEVGTGIVVKKTPEQTQKVVENQIKRLKETRIQIISQLEIYHYSLQELISKIQK